MPNAPPSSAGRSLVGCLGQAAWVEAGAWLWVIQTASMWVRPDSSVTGTQRMDSWFVSIWMPFVHSVFT